MPTTVMFDGVEASEVTVVSPTELAVTLPAGTTAGLVDVSVETSAGSDSLAGGFEYMDEPNLELTIPAEIPVEVGEPELYTTRLTNFGAEAFDVTEEIRISNPAGDLVAADVRYGSMDVGQVWNEVTWTEDAGDLVATYTFSHTRAGLDQSSDVQILVVREDTGDLTASSTYTDADDTVLAQAVYTFTVTGGA
jgi:hypothetical protein